jgi:thiazole synthase
MEEAILASASELVTVALKRIDLETETDAILKHYSIRTSILPNTSGARNAKEAVFAAQLERSIRNQLAKIRNPPRS